MGGGSNILFTKDFNGIVIKIALKGIRKIRETAKNIHFAVGAGENWHEFVMYCVENGLPGVENLALIPGTVGAAPIQNIGAYGVELKDVLTRVETISLRDGSRKLQSKTLLQMGYRDSIFKLKAKDKYIISSVHFKFPKAAKYNVSYGAIQATLAQNGVEQLSIKAISDAVIQIRKSKLPDPAILGNAGSFFKNPTISIVNLQELQKSFPNIPHYPFDEFTVKLAAGWMIEQCGWKGKIIGKAGVHKEQALVIVNYGGATGEEIWDLAKQIISSVELRFNIKLSTEVNIV